MNANDDLVRVERGEGARDQWAHRAADERRAAIVRKRAQRSLTEPAEPDGARGATDESEYAAFEELLRRRDEKEAEAARWAGPREMPVSAEAPTQPERHARRAVVAFRRLRGR